MILQHFVGNDRAQPPIVTAVAYQAIVDPTFNRIAAEWIAGSYKTDKDSGFDRGVTVYTGDGDDKSVQIKSIRPEAPTRVYLGEGDDIASVLPKLDAGGTNIGLTQINDRSKDPHDKLEVFGGDGNDRIDLSKALVNVRAFGGDGNDRLIGSTGFDILIGGDGDDWIEGYGSTLLKLRDGDTLLDLPTDDSLWGSQIEVLVGDHLGRYFEQPGTGSDIIRFQLPGFIDVNSQDFDARWMERGGLYLFDRTDNAGQFQDLTEALNGDGILREKFRGAAYDAEWNSLVSPSETLGTGGNDLIFSGVALPSGLGMSTLADAATRTGTNVIFGGAGRDRIFAGDTHAAHRFGHVIVGDEARLVLRDDNDDPIFKLRDIAAAILPQNNPRGDDWIVFGAGPAQVLSGRGHDAIFGGVNADGSNAGSTAQVNIVSSMGEIQFEDGTTTLGFMKSLEDQPDGDDTVLMGENDVRWIGGGGNDRIWVGYETDLTEAARFSVWKNYGGTDSHGQMVGNAPLRDILGQNPASFSLTTVLPYQRSADVQSPEADSQFQDAYLLDGTTRADKAIGPESWTWIPATIQVIDTSTTRRTQTVTLLSDYAQIERTVLNRAGGLEDGYNYEAADIQLFRDDQELVVEVAKSITPSVDFDATYENLPLSLALQSWNRGDGGHDQITVGSARGQIIAGEGNDQITSGENRAATDDTPDRSSDLVVAGDAAQVHRFAADDSRYDNRSDFPRLIRVSTSTELAKVDVQGTEESQAYRGGDDEITLGTGQHVVLGGLGRDEISVATTEAGLDQIVAGDGATMLFDPRLDLNDPLLDLAQPRALLYFETMERNSALLATELRGVNDNDDTISIGNGDVLATGGLGNDELTLGKGRQFIAGDYASFLTAQYKVITPAEDSNPEVGRQEMIFEDRMPGVVGGDDTITSKAEQVVFIGGGGHDTATLQQGMSAGNEGHAFAIGGRGQFVFELDLPGTDGFRNDARSIPGMFSVLTLKEMETLDTQLLPKFNIADPLEEPVTVTTNDKVVGPDGTIYTYIPNASLRVSDWADATVVDFTDKEVWFAPTSASQEEKNLTGGDDTIHMSYGRLVAMGGGGADTLTGLGGYTAANGDLPSAIFAGDSARLSLTSDPEEWKVQIFESRRAPPPAEDLDLTGARGSATYGKDVIDLGSGHLLAIGGEGDDTIRNGDGRAIVLGDHGEMVFSVSDDHKIATVSNAPRGNVDESLLFSQIAGDDVIELGQGSLQIVMGGDGNDTVTTQTDGAGTPQAGATLNDSYFAGDRAELVFDPSADGAKMTRFTAKGDPDSGDGDDSFTTADGDVRAVLGYGADSLTMGHGMAILLGDGGEILANTTSFALNTLTYLPDAEPDRDGTDTIVSGDGDMAAILGGASDSLDTGNGEVLGLGDWGVLRFDDTDVLREVSNTPTESHRAAALAYAGNDTFRLGEGVRHVIMGGAGNDTVTAQVDGMTARDALSSDQSYFAGDHADLVFDALQTPGDLVTEMLTFTGTDWTGFDGNDSFTTGNGEVRAILGVGSDTLVQGDELGYVLGDLGTLNQNNPAYILGRIEAAPVPFTFATGQDSWTAGDGEHVAIMGAADDTVRLGDGPVQVLLDHGFTQRDVTNAKLIHTEDETAEGWGNDSLVAGSGWGFVIGGGGNDDIATGRTDQGTNAAVDGRHILLGDAGYVDFDPTLSGDMGLVRIEAYLPQIRGNDRLWGGAGYDVVIGGAGSDEVHGEVGRDFVAGDFLLVEYERGLGRNVITQRDYYAQGAGDLVTTGYDGDFVFGGTQSNTMGVAASVDIIFETFGRILFEQGRGIDKVERIFNMGIASSLLNDRVRDGQLAVAGDAPPAPETQEAAPDAAIPMIDDAGDLQAGTLGIEEGNLSREGGTTGQADLTETTDLEGVEQAAAANPPPADRPLPTAEAPKFASAAADVTGAPFAKVAAERLRTEAATPKILAARGQIAEEQEEMLSFLEASAVLSASATAYRQYGKPRSVGSLEQRLRIWTENGFMLRGDASTDARL